MAVAAWIVTCTCGWYGSAYSLAEACDMISVHEQDAMRGHRHFVAIKGEVATSERPPADN
jgi:hypothetical protein